MIEEKYRSCANCSTMIDSYGLYVFESSYCKVRDKVIKTSDSPKEDTAKCEFCEYYKRKEEQGSKDGSK